MRLGIVEFLYVNEHIRKDIQTVHLKAVSIYTHFSAIFISSVKINAIFFSFLIWRSFMQNSTEFKLNLGTMLSWLTV